MKLLLVYVFSALPNWSLLHETVDIYARAFKI